LKPYGGSRTFNNQFTSSQKPVWVLGRTTGKKERKAAAQPAKRSEE